MRENTLKHQLYAGKPASVGRLLQHGSDAYLKKMREAAGAGK